MIEREKHGGVTVHCDRCSEFVEADTFKEAIDGMKEAGWRTTRLPENDWEHHCPGCVLEESEKDGGGMPDETW